MNIHARIDFQRHAVAKVHECSVDAVKVINKELMLVCGTPMLKVTMTSDACSHEVFTNMAVSEQDIKDLKEVA